MSEDAGSFAGMRRVPDQERELAWLLEQPGMDVVTGLDPVGWEDSTWVLHAMYENSQRTDTGTYDDVRLLRVATGESEMIGDIDLDAVTTDTGIPLGYVGHPGPGWSRLTWADLLAREGRGLSDPFGVPPCFRWFTAASFPLAIQPPPEGSMDLETFTDLIDVIASHESAGADTECFAFMGCLAVDMDPDDPYHLWRGRLGDLPTLLDREDQDYYNTPTNWWPVDRSWFVMTDADLQGTKISGSHGLVDAVRRDLHLETTDWTRRA